MYMSGVAGFIRDDTVEVPPLILVVLDDLGCPIHGFNEDIGVKVFNSGSWCSTVLHGGSTGGQ